MVRDNYIMDYSCHSCDKSFRVVWGKKENVNIDEGVLDFYKEEWKKNHPSGEIYCLISFFEGEKANQFKNNCSEKGTGWVRIYNCENCAEQIKTRYKNKKDFGSSWVGIKTIPNSVIEEINRGNSSCRKGNDGCLIVYTIKDCPNCGKKTSNETAKCINHGKENVVNKIIPHNCSSSQPTVNNSQSPTNWSTVILYGFLILLSFLVIFLIIKWLRRKRSKK